jgi:hypothetical protein
MNSNLSKCDKKEIINQKNSCMNTCKNFYDEFKLDCKIRNTNNEVINEKYYKQCLNENTNNIMYCEKNCKIMQNYNIEIKSDLDA